MDSKLLEKFFRKECTTEEVQQVLSWFEKENINQEELWKSEWNESDQKGFFDSTGLASSLLDEIHHSLPPVKLKKYKQEIVLKIAAVLLIAVASSLAVWHLADKKRFDSIAFTENKITDTPSGMKKIFHLKDSSRVYLNSESKITYPENFISEKREVRLEGEAYFEVKKNPARPFIVKTGDLVTTALGTAFNISSFHEDNTITVSLTEGKVQIDYKNNPENRLILVAGEQITLDKLSGKITKTTFDPSLIVAWTKNIIVFESASLEEIIEKLERWYGVTIEIEKGNPDLGEDWDYSGEYNNESLRNVLDGISFVKNFTYKMEDKYVKIYMN